MLSEALAWEDFVMKDGKKRIAVPVDGVFGLEARYYSKYPERYAFVLTPRMGVVARANRNLAQYQPIRFWSLEELRAVARDTALFAPSGEMLKAMTAAGFQVKQLESGELKVFYLK